MRWQAILGLASIVIGTPGCEIILGLEKGVYQECEFVDECAVTDGRGAMVLSCTANVCIYDEVPANEPDTVAALAAGWHHTCALSSRGTVKCWGRNDHGQLGLGDTENRGDEANEMGAALPTVFLGKGKRATALAAGAFHTCALLNDKSVKCWGLNGVGQLGLGDTRARGVGMNEMGDDLPAVDVGIGNTVEAIAAGAYHTCALLTGGGVKCWGANASGQLGVGDTVPRGNKPNQMGAALSTVNLGDGIAVSTLSAGGYFTCVLLMNESVKCWGDNSAGQLGLGDEEARGDDANEMGDQLPTVALGAGVAAESISCGYQHVCARLNGYVKCWGANSYGQLGLGDISSSGMVFLVGAHVVVAGNNHSCAVPNDLSVKCSGWNQFGQLGLGDTNDRGDEANEMGDALPSVDLGVNAMALVVAGFAHTCALLDDFKVKCWGRNADGQLGLGDKNDRGDGPGEMGEMLPAAKLFAGEL